MTKGKKPTASKGKARSLKLKKETLKDLDAKGKSQAVRGGAARATRTLCGGGCPSEITACACTG